MIHASMPATCFNQQSEMFSFLSAFSSQRKGVILHRGTDTTLSYMSICTAEHLQASECHVQRGGTVPPHPSPILRAVPLHPYPPSTSFCHKQAHLSHCFPEFCETLWRGNQTRERKGNLSFVVSSSEAQVTTLGL